MAGTNGHEQGDVFQTAVNNHDAAADLNAVKQVHANEKLEHDALAALPAAQQAQYRALAHDVEHNPQAHLALQMLLVEGKLTGGAKTLVPAGHEQTLLDSLSKVHSEPLANGVNRAELLGGLLRECAQPATIQQKDVNTCTVTSVQIMMARQNPAEYVRIVGGLAAQNVDKHGHPNPNGTPAPVQLAGPNQTVTRPFLAESDDHSGRSISSQLWQSSMMDLGAKQTNPNAQYDAVSHVFIGADGNNLKDAAGNDVDTLNANQLQGVENAVTGKTWGQADRGFMANQIETEVQASVGHGTPIHVTMGVGPYNHHGTQSTQDMTVTAFANGQYTLKDAAGNTQTMSAADFNARVKASFGHGQGQPATLSMAAYDRLMLDTLRQNAQANPGGVPVALKWGNFKPDGTTDPIGHEVLVTRVENGRVFYTNPHGNEESMGEEEFLNRIGEMSMRTDLPTH
jgi:hypothetical protein